MYNQYDKTWNKARKEMWASGAEIWCNPNISYDGRVEFSSNEGKIENLMIDGIDMDITPDNIKLAAQILNDEYDEYNHDYWTDREIIDDARGETYESAGCWRCPWFTECQQMDDQIGDFYMSDEEEAELDAAYA